MLINLMEHEHAYKMGRPDSTAKRAVHRQGVWRTCPCHIAYDLDRVDKATVHALVGAQKWLRTCAQFGSSWRSWHRWQPRCLASLPHRQGLVPVVGSLPDFRDAHCGRTTDL